MLKRPPVRLFMIAVVDRKAVLPAGTSLGTPNKRFEWDAYSLTDKHAYVNAIQCLKDKAPSGDWAPARSRYEDIVRVHQEYAPYIHSRSTSQQTHRFLLWHRYYVWAFEQVLRDECGFDRAMPWWDEEKWAGKFSQSTLFTDQWFGRLHPANDGNATCVNTGRFAGWELYLGPGSATDNRYCLQRAVMEDVTEQTGIQSLNTCLQRTEYPNFHSCVEFSFHAQGHNGVGGVMADAIASPGDPSFFMHHLYVDYAFRRWQNVDVARRTTISGCADVDDCSPLTLDTPVSVGGICGSKKCPDLTVRDVLDTTDGHFCYTYLDN
ncbi:Di-copper centre-containing protein [Xylariaceae sp. FL0804]|nr:Di-copper centre-containing protein [Xylariaceae sp. FL0804]